MPTNEGGLQEITEPIGLSEVDDRIRLLVKSEERVRLYSLNFNKAWALEHGLAEIRTRMECEQAAKAVAIHRRRPRAHG